MRTSYASRVNSRDLETLLWVVKLGGVGAAARHLNLAQPTVTRRIQELERELRAPLFRREGRHVVPTPVARTCLVHAERILSDVAAMRLTASGREALPLTVRAGFVETIGLTWFGRLLARVAETFPNVTVEMTVDLSARLVERLARGRLDIVFIPGPVPVAGAVTIPIGQSEFRWLASPSLVPPGSKLSPAMVARLPLLMSPRGSDVHGMVMRWFGAAGIRPERISFCDNLSVLAALVRKGVGVGPLPPILFKEAIVAGALAVLPEVPRMNAVEFSAAYLPSAELHMLPEIASIAQEESSFARV